VVHHSRVQKVVIDVPEADADRAACFWAGAVGTELARLYEGFPEYRDADLPYDESITLLVQSLGRGAGRIHLDIHTDDLEAEATRLERLGATRVRKEHDWWVMRDPAGLLFCVLPVAAGSLSEGNAVRWD